MGANDGLAQGAFPVAALGKLDREIAANRRVILEPQFFLIESDAPVSQSGEGERGGGGVGCDGASAGCRR